MLVLQDEQGERLREDQKRAQTVKTEAVDLVKRAEGELKGSERAIEQDKKIIKKDKEAIETKRQNLKSQVRRLVKVATETIRLSQVDKFGGAEERKRELEKCLETLDNRKRALATGMDTDAESGENKTWQQSLMGVLSSLYFLCFEYVRLAEARTALTAVTNELRDVTDDIKRKTNRRNQARDRLRRVSQSTGGDRAQYDQLKKQHDHLEVREYLVSLLG